jgi:hypothetical protein
MLGCIRLSFYGSMVSIQGLTLSEALGAAAYSADASILAGSSLHRSISVRIAAACFCSVLTAFGLLDSAAL